MKIKLTGHDYRYAADQMLLTLFPDERSEFVDALDGTGIEIRITEGNTYMTAITEMKLDDGRSFRGVAKVATSELSDKIVKDRLLQRAVKQSFYKAGIQLTKKPLAWGALTGIRPGKLVTDMLLAGKSDFEAMRTMENDYYVSTERAALCLDTAKFSLEVMKSLSGKSICLYVGIPFCPTRCAYCSFVSNSVEKSFHMVEPFFETLKREVRETAPVIKELGLVVESVYFGGGTPTTLSAEMLSELIFLIRESFSVDNNIEFTVEAGRPDTITEEKLDALQKSGVTRVCVNPQTLNDDVLQKIGRRHTAKQAIKAAQLIKEKYSFSLNMDLIAGLPGDTPESFEDTLDTVLNIGADNITVHTLSLKKGAKIMLEGTEIPDGEAVGKMLDYASSRLSSQGFRPYYLYRQKFMSGGYENVGWSLPGCENLYNVCIMEELCSIISLGAGASTKLVSPEKGRIERVFNPKYANEYINGIEKTLENKQLITAFYREEGL